MAACSSLLAACCSLLAACCSLLAAGCWLLAPCSLLLAARSLRLGVITCLRDAPEDREANQPDREIKQVKHAHAPDALLNRRTRRNGRLPPACGATVRRAWATS